MTDEGYRSYQGVRLVASEARVLEELEERLEHPIPLVTAFGREYEDWFGFIAENNHVIKLALDHQELPSLPASLGTLGHLRLLRVVSNQLQTLPETVVKLQSLQTLILFDNQLLSIPETIGQLQNLHKLDLTSNQLQALPETIGQLQSLEELVLWENPLESSLASMLHLLWLAQRNNIFEKWLPYKLLTHPLVQPLVRDSLTYLRNSVCPFCGASGLVTGCDKKTNQKKTFCSACENSIQ